MNLIAPTAGFAGEFRFIVSKDADMTEIVSDTGFVPNLITDAGLNHVATNNGLVSTLAVGTGTTPPTVLDTSLESQLAQLSVAPSTVTNTAGGYVETTFSGQFGAGVAAGNLSEFGAKYGSTLWSRALIKDSGGTPTTITVLSNEFLTVVYKVRLYWPTTDTIFTTTMDIDGVATPVTIKARAREGWQYTQRIGAESGQYLCASYRNAPLPASGLNVNPTSNSCGYGVIQDLPYVANSYQRSCTINIPIGGWNGEAAIYCIGTGSGGLGDWWYELSVPLVKDNTKTLTYTVGQSWGRYVP